LLARAAADIVVLAHLAFIAFVVFGALLVLKWRRVAWVHLPAVLWGAAVEFFGLICPLTPLEMHLRDVAGMAAYEGDFVGHYIVPVMYPAGLTPAIQAWLGALVVLSNVALYGLVFARGRRRRGGEGV